MDKTRYPVYLIHGDLGSGKTTLVTQLLKQPRFQNAIIIENEFASENIDEATLGVHPHGKTYALNGGCICCSSGEEFEKILARIPNETDSVPVIVETTGVASSLQLLQKLFLSDTFHEHYVLMRNILVVDLSEHKSFNSNALDVRLADTVLLNKSDLLEHTHAETIAEDIQRKNVGAEVFIVSHMDVPPHIFESEHLSNVETLLFEMSDEIAPSLDINHTTAMRYAVFDMPESVALGVVEERIHTLMQDGTIIRIKGNIRDTDGHMWHVEATRHHTHITPVPRIAPLKLVAIGTMVPDNFFLKT